MSESQTEAGIHGTGGADDGAEEEDESASGGCEASDQLR
jgi:hypothetical protein